jgi:hypothetical protein
MFEVGEEFICRVIAICIQHGIKVVIEIIIACFLLLFVFVKDF